MMTHYDDKQARKMRLALVADNLFCMVRGAVKHDVDVWMAALELTHTMMECAAPEELVEDFVKEVSEDEEETFEVVMVSICQLSAKRWQVANADDLIKLLLPFVHDHSRFASMLEKVDGKEQQMRMVGKKVELMTYEMKQVADENRQALVDSIDAFISTSMQLGTATMRDNLLVLNLVNLQYGHVLDEKILEMYGKMMEQSAQKPTFEVTLGNKNVANEGSMQMNTPIPTDPGNMLAMLNSLKGLTDGRR